MADNPPIVINLTGRDYFIWEVDLEQQSKLEGGFNSGKLWVRPRDVNKGGDSLFKNDDKFAKITSSSKQMAYNNCDITIFNPPTLSPDRTIILITSPEYKGQFASLQIVTEFSKKFNALQYENDNLKEQIQDLKEYHANHNVKDEIVNESFGTAMDVVRGFKQAEKEINPFENVNNEKKDNQRQT